MSIGCQFFDDCFNVCLNVMYVCFGFDNVLNFGYDEFFFVMYGWFWYLWQVVIDDLCDYWEFGFEGVQQCYVEDFWVNNFWFVVNENINSFSSNCVIGNLQLFYELNDNFDICLCYGVDVVDDEWAYCWVFFIKAILGENGSYCEDEIFFIEMNVEVLIGYYIDWGNGFCFVFDVKFGGNIMW